MTWWRRLLDCLLLLVEIAPLTADENARQHGRLWRWRFCTMTVSGGAPNPPLMGAFVLI